MTAMTAARLEWILDKAELRDEVLSAWERQFLADMGDRLDSYGDQTFISEKQAATLERISEKVG